MRTKLIDKNSIPAVLQELTLEEKASLLITPKPCTTTAIEDMDIPEIVLADGVTGANGTVLSLDFLAEITKRMMQQNFNVEKKEGAKRQGSGNLFLDMLNLLGMEKAEAEEKAKGNPLYEGFMQFLEYRRGSGESFVSFPSGINIGATFNEESAYHIAQALGEEMRACHIDVCLGPNADIMRDPLGGRNYEMYGEDPVLVGRICSAFVDGLQSTGTAACAKHYIANNQETRRQTKDTHVSIRTLREVYARGFECAVKNAGAKSIMTAYNAVNGKFSSYNSMILRDWLKGEWGFDGIVVSDWGAASQNSDQAINAGLDMVLHGPHPCNINMIVDAVKEGTLSEEKLNDAVARVLDLILWLRERQKSYSFQYNQATIRKAVYDTIVDGAVLLKNEQHTLPLMKASKTAFYGARAKDTMECGNGSTYVTTSLHSNVVDASKKLGVDVYTNDMDLADTVVYVAAASGGENADRTEMDLDEKKEILQVLKRAKDKNKKTVVLLNICGPVDVRAWEEYADAILSIFIPGCEGGNAMADLLYGEATPCGRLPVTFPEKYKDTPSYPYFPGEYDEVYYGEGVFVGYRWYDSRQLPVKYPFGYGLSYTSFEIGNVMVPATYDSEKDETFCISVDVRNTGNCAGAEVVQVYMNQKHARILRPEKELKAFGKVYLLPGEEKTVELFVRREDLMIFDPEKGMVIPIDEYSVKVGVNSRDIVAECSIEITGKNVYILGEESTVGEILASPEAIAIVEKHMPGFTSQWGDHIQLMSNNVVGPMLSQYSIKIMPDAVQGQKILEQLYVELARI